MPVAALLTTSQAQLSSCMHSKQLPAGQRHPSSSLGVLQDATRMASSFQRPGITNPKHAGQRPDAIAIAQHPPCLCHFRAAAHHHRQLSTKTWVFWQPSMVCNCKGSHAFAPLHIGNALWWQHPAAALPLNITNKLHLLSCAVPDAPVWRALHQQCVSTNQTIRCPTSHHTAVKTPLSCIDTSIHPHRTNSHIYLPRAYAHPRHRNPCQTSCLCTRAWL
jgi:hypothetical protein